MRRAYLVSLLVLPEFMYLVATVADSEVFSGVFVPRVLEFEVVEGGLDLIHEVLSMFVAYDGEHSGFQ